MDATEDQETRIQAILRATVEDMFELGQQHHSNRDAFVAAMSQETIDRQQLESIRLEELQLAESASSQLVETLADVAEVLTLEQRQEMLERFRKHHR